LLALVGLLTAISAFIGAKVVSSLPIGLLKPIILFILISIAIYTYLKKDLGGQQTKNLSTYKQYLLGATLGVVIGFYDGFFGPGTGSFLVLGFVALLGFDFLHASAYAKVINCIANIGALTVYINNSQFLLVPALIIAIFNIVGNITGSKMAIAKGNLFIRKVFLVIVLLMIARYAYDILRYDF
nr:TSUP family transporter [Bacteroidales bacterium]